MRQCRLVSNFVKNDRNFVSWTQFLWLDMVMHFRSASFKISRLRISFALWRAVMTEVVGILNFITSCYWCKGTFFEIIFYSCQEYAPVMH